MFLDMTTSDFLRKASEDVCAFGAKAGDKNLAMNAVVSLHHLHEWVWQRSLKNRVPLVIRGTTIRTCKDFKAWLQANCPHFNLLRELANGTKHCAVKVPTKTARHSEVMALVCGPLVTAPLLGSWDLPPRVEVDLGDGSAFVPLKHVLETSLNFWISLHAEVADLAP
jgi:hypothetical protein